LSATPRAAVAATILVAVACWAVAAGDGSAAAIAGPRHAPRVVHTPARGAIHSPAGGAVHAPAPRVNHIPVPSGRPTAAARGHHPPIPGPAAGPAPAAKGVAEVVVQTMDSCKSGIDGGVYELSGPGGTFTAGAAAPSVPSSVVGLTTCPLQQGNCAAAAKGCVIFRSIPAGDYRLKPTSAPGPNATNTAGYAPCEGGSACVWEAADVTVNPDGSVLAKVSNMFPNGRQLSWPSDPSHPVYLATTADPIVFHDFGLAKPGTAGDLQCDSDADADDWSTGTPSSVCQYPEAAEATVCPGSPAPHFPWMCANDPNPVQHLVSSLPGTPAATFIGNLYRDVLGRPTAPSMAEVSFWTAQMNGGMPRSQIAGALARSDEAHGLLGNAVYGVLLGRPADPAGLASWVRQLHGGASIEDVAAAVAGSAEYYAGHGRGTDAGFVTALYRDVLQRTPLAAEVNGWLASGPIGDRTGVARAFVLSHEYHGYLVRACYQRYLARPADAAGLAFWTAQLDQNADADAVIAALTSTDEYYARTRHF
jgi:hypothetical protein